MNNRKKLFASMAVVLALLMALAVGAWATGNANKADLNLVLAPETQLDVYVDGTWSGELSDTYAYGDTATIKAPAASGSKNFSHWTVDGSIVSYSNPLKLTMNAHTTLYAVYANSVTAKPVAGFTSITRTNDGKSISFQAIASADTAGIVYSTTATGNALKIGGTGVTNEAAVKSADLTTTLPNSILDGNNCWMLQITPASGDTVYHARAYVTVSGTTTYGDVKDVKLSDLQSGVSLTANLDGIDPQSDSTEQADLTNALAHLANSMRTVTFDANGGTGTMAPQGVVSGTATKLNANTFTREGYTFSGWSTNKNGGGTTYTDGQSVTLSEDTALYAQWRSNYSGSSSSGGSSTTTVTVPVTSDATPGTVPVKASVSGTTATVTKLTDEQLAQVTTNKSGNKDGDAEAETNVVSIDVSGVAKDVKTAAIPTETVKAVEETGSNLKVTLTDGSVELDAVAQTAIINAAKGTDIRVNLDAVSESSLNAAQQSALKEVEVQKVVDVYITSNGQRISDFKGGMATVSVPYTLKGGQVSTGLAVWYVADNGTRSQVPSSYDGKNIVFGVPHFSNYVIAYDAEQAKTCPKDNTCPISAFTDTKATAWYHDGVHWAIENGVMNGVGNGKFEPNDTTTRAQVVTMLWRLEGSPAYVGMSEFSDVDNEEWYGPAIRWASSEGIVNGYDGKFAPNDPVTREQLVTILYRYAQYKKMDVSVGEDTNILSYDDAFDVSEWAIPAMQWAVGAGVVNGTSASTLSPKNNASRAEIATIVMRYCEKNAK